MKKIYSTILCIGLASAGFAQVTITGADVNGTIGESFTFFQTDYISPGSAGASQTWDLSTVTTGASGTIDHTSPNLTFPASNITQVQGTNSLYYDFSASGQTIHGIDAGGTVMTYSDGMTTIGFPLSMGTTGNDTHTATFTSGGFPFTRSGTTSWDADGWGTLITPAGTFTNVLRVFETQVYQDTWSGPAIDYNIEIYAWYKAGIHYPVASMTSVTTTSGSQTYGTYLDINLSVEELNAMTFTIAPNPANDQVIVTQFNGTFGSMVITDMGGKVVVESDSHTADISGLNSGVYFVKVIDQHGTASETQKLIKL